MMKRIVKRSWIVLLVALSPAVTCLPASAGVITTDTVWKGEVSVPEDLVVPKGVTLTILPGTVVKIAPSESTKTDPEYLSPLTEITIRGTLKAEGTPAAPIVVGLADGGTTDGWAGIIVDGGTLSMKFCTIRDAEAGVQDLRGSVTIKNSLLLKNRYGLVVQGPGTSLRIEKSEIRDNDYGVILTNGAKLDNKNSIVAKNRKKDVYSASLKDSMPAEKTYRIQKTDASKIYDDAVLLGDTIWQGVIEVNGVVRVPEDARLVIMPGTLVAVRKRDTNHDGIGENGLLIQGILVAKGTRDQPIIFRSGEQNRKMGDWDAINIMNSDAAQNLIEFCQIEDAYRGLHFHFSNVAIHNSIVRNNYRGIQFQESTVDITANQIYGNKSGVQGRDADVLFNDNALYHNYSGANFFRTRLAAARNVVASNLREGLRIREGVPVVEENTFDGNRYGLMIADTRYGTFRRNVIAHNAESGLLLKGTDNVEVAGNEIQSNGFSGITVQDSSAVVKGNDISYNGERGIGVLSFSGIITENNIAYNAVYDLDLDGSSDISAPLNWWGAAARPVIDDKTSDPRKGAVQYLPVRKEPVLFSWPVSNITSDIIWRGNIRVQDTVTVLPGARLTVSPPATISFSRGVGISVKGGIEARGDKPGSILFTSADKADDAEWGEVFIEHSDNSHFSNCDFEAATWAVHCHFSHLRIENCRFRNNYGGIRFRGGPLEVRRSLFNRNSIGIRAYRGTASFEENTFTDNEVGIFVREKGGGLTIKRNNLYHNTDYNVRVGDFNDQDVSAPDNFWGSEDPSQTILDGRKEHGIGIVHYDPFRNEPYRTVDRKVSK